MEESVISMKLEWLLLCFEEVKCFGRKHVLLIYMVDGVKDKQIFLLN